MTPLTPVCNSYPVVIMALSRIFSEIKRYIGRKFLHIPLNSTPRTRRNIATPFGMEKLELCGYQTVKSFMTCLAVST